MRWGGYIFVLALGSLSLNAGLPTNVTVQQSNAVQQPANVAEQVLPTNQKIAAARNREEYEAPCAFRQEKRSSELCAQWKAADAAQEGIWWAAVGTWVSGISGLLVIGALYLAFQSNCIARKSATRQLRAYVGWTKFDLSVHKDAKGGLFDATIEAHWKNFGQTPATNLSDRLNWLITSEPLPDRFEFTEGNSNGPCDSLVLGPSATFQSISSQLLSANDYWALVAANKKIFVWSSVTYTDVFGQRRRTEVGAELVIKQLKSGEQAIIFNAIPQHNGMDDGCMRPALGR